MKCPVCLATELLMTVREGIEINYCPACRGVWLDRGELDQIIRRASQASMAKFADAADHHARKPYRDGRDPRDDHRLRNHDRAGDVREFPCNDGGLHGADDASAYPASAGDRW